MRWLAAGLLVLAAGCASAPAPNNSSLAKARLSEAETRAANLAKSGDFPGAARFQMLLKEHRHLVQIQRL